MPGAVSVQGSCDFDKKGRSLWTIERLNDDHVVRIKNVHSGKYLCFQSDLKPGQTVKATQVDLTKETESSTIWMLELTY